MIIGAAYAFKANLQKKYNPNNVLKKIPYTVKFIPINRKCRIQDTSVSRYTVNFIFVLS